ncbi:MAG: hypothetical protein Q8O00_07800, partial [Holophaga sp.]|nr:hypothetical protein [Holophaga sp.]
MMPRLLALFAFSTACALAGAASAATTAAPEGWRTAVIRDEIAPQFSYDSGGGPDRTGAFVIESDQRAGLVGRWVKTFPVSGGRHYGFQAMRRVSRADGRRAAVVRLLWQDAKGKPVMHDEPSTASHKPGEKPRAEPEYPMDRATDARGWTVVADVYRAPSRAVQAV